LDIAAFGAKPSLVKDGVFMKFLIPSLAGVTVMFVASATCALAQPTSQIGCAEPLTVIASQVPIAAMQGIVNKISNGDPSRYAFWQTVLPGISPAYALNNPAILGDVLTAEFLFTLKTLFASNVVPSTPNRRPATANDFQSQAMFNSRMERMADDFAKAIQFNTNTPFSAGAVAQQQQIRDQVQACFPGPASQLHEAAIRIAGQMMANRAREEQHQNYLRKQADDYVRHQQEQTADVEAEAKKPANLLKSAYSDYKYLKRCFEAREGYVAINLSEEELDRARQAAKRIEEILKPLIGNDVDTNQLWDAASSAGPRDMNVFNRSMCQFRYSALMKSYAQIAPEDQRIQKDF
jgi:hypothetical protein